MSFMNLFSGPSAEDLELRGDALLKAGDGGRAKLTYEKALEKRKKEEMRTPSNGRRQKGLAEKILLSRDLLAREHQQQAHDYADGEYWQEALEMLSLAEDICSDAEVQKELQKERQEIGARKIAADNEIDIEPDYETEVDDDTLMVGEVSEEEYFIALCSTLPDEVQELYLSYGQDFKNGYIALNRGDFESAGRYLEQAMAQSNGVESYISMELATAYLNSGKMDEARELLVQFIANHSGVLPAYRLLCEVYWDKKDFARAHELLASVEPELQKSIAIVQLEGQTLFQAGRYTHARDHYRGVLDRYGWNETIASELAKTHEVLDETADAMGIYKEIMANCSHCGAKIDPMIRHNYAELCFTENMHKTEILEIYLSLAQEVPDNAAIYYDRVSRIYTTIGNDLEARRFRSFAQRAGFGEQGNRSF